MDPIAGGKDRSSVVSRKYVAKVAMSMVSGFSVQVVAGHWLLAAGLLSLPKSHCQLVSGSASSKKPVAKSLK